MEDLYDVVRRAAPYRDLPRDAYLAVLDMLAGRYPGDDFAELKPRIVWDRTSGEITARPGAQRLAVTSGGTIPDRGLYAVYLIGTTSRVGELDEEMVYESRVGDVFALGATSWRIEEITPDRVWVSPAPGQPAKLPFWHGDSVGRPIELGRAVGEFLRAARDPDSTRAHLAESGLDAWAMDNLIAYLEEQRDDIPVVRSTFARKLVAARPRGRSLHAIVSAHGNQGFKATRSKVMLAGDGVWMPPDAVAVLSAKVGERIGVTLIDAQGNAIDPASPARVAKRRGGGAARPRPARGSAAPMGAAPVRRAGRRR